VLGAALLAAYCCPTAKAQAGAMTTPSWQSPIIMNSAEYTGLQHEAQQVTITRDDWGIPHIRGKTDADAVFGAMYAQCEDDFSRVQSNLLGALGWTAQAEGEQAVWADLRAQLFIDPVVLKQDYAKSPEWLKKLLNAWADGLNWYLATHPNLHPKVIRRYEPWMALSFTEGSIGGNINKVDLAALAKFYGADEGTAAALSRAYPPPKAQEIGSNGIAIAPKLSANGHALLLINPHVTFNFRTESQMSSGEGLDAYGASTWGQFFIYQGFNRHIGWMHTTSGIDNVDQFAETVRKRDGRYFYLFGKQWLPIKTRNLVIPYAAADGSVKTRTFTAYFTQHGPIVAKQSGKWIAEAMMNRPIPAL
jgi:acyl-homoserine-lactone acylase